MSKLIIEAGRTERHYWRDLWRYRELFYILALRDILVRYKQTVIGFAWAILRRLLTMVVFTVIFGKLAKAAERGANPSRNKKCSFMTYPRQGKAYYEDRLVC